MIEIALTCEYGLVSASTLISVAAAINKQVQDEFGAAWKIQVRVTAYSTGSDVPTESCRVFLGRDRSESELGFHVSDGHRPYVHVAYETSWVFAVSQACLEMAADGTGNESITGNALVIGIDGRISEDTTRTLDYVLEISRPCQSIDCGYLIDGWPVSDFALPDFYTGTQGTADRYSFKGHLTAAHRLAIGGYVSWVKVDSTGQKQLWQLQNLAGGPLVAGPVRVEERESLRRLSYELATNSERPLIHADPQHPLLMESARLRSQRAIKAERNEAKAGKKFPGRSQPASPRDRFWHGLASLAALVVVLAYVLWLRANAAPQSDLPVPLAVLLNWMAVGLVVAIIFARARVGQARCEQRARRGHRYESGQKLA